MSLESTQIVVHRILNPFDPSKVERDLIEWVPDRSIAQYFQKTVFTPEYVVSVNGKIIASEQSVTTYLLPEDHVVICPIPEGGGGGGKGILRTLALIAVSVASGGLATTGFAGISGLGLTGFAATAATAAFIVGGTLLVNAILPPALPKGASVGTDAFETSKSYGIDGAKNTSDEGIPVPVCYGKFFMAGNLINAYVENVDTENQDLYLLFNAGEGEVENITDFRINDEPASNYDSFEFATRRGTAVQEPISWFSRTRRAKSVSRTLQEGFIEFQSTGEIDAARVDLVLPQGLFDLNAQTGNTSARSVDIEVEALNLSEGIPDNWVKCDVIEAYGQSTDSTFDTATPVERPTIRLTSRDLTAQFSSVAPFGKTTVRITAAKKQAIRYSLPIQLPQEAEYLFRIRRFNAPSESDFSRDDVAITDLVEVINDKVTYPHTALVGVRIRLNDQLSGLPNITYLNHGVRVMAYNRRARTWELTSSGNPAWIVWDILTNTRYGGGLPYSRMNLNAFASWAEFCEEEGLTFNGVVDQTTNVWDFIQLVCRVGHAQIIRVGTKYSIAIERKERPTMMFGVSNIIKDSFQINWISMSDRANELELTYYDENDFNKEKTIRIYDPQLAAQGVPQKSVSINLVGVTNPERAYKEGVMQLNQNRLIRQSVTFEAPIEAVACTVGSLVYVQHDMPQWGFSGRLLPALQTTTQVKLDRKVPMTAGKPYNILIHSDQVDIATGTITSVIGANTLILNSTTWGEEDGLPSRAKRLVLQNGTELAIEHVYKDGQVLTVTVNKTSGATAGQTFRAVDTDVIIERPVVNIVQDGTEEFDTLTLLSPMSFAPAPFSSWMFGEIERIKKPFRVRAIEGSSDDMNRKLVCVEYNESAFDIQNPENAVPTPNYSSLTAKVQQVRIEGVTETLRVQGVGFMSDVTVSFFSSQETFKHGKVYVSKNGGAYTLVGSSRNQITFTAAERDLLKIRVVAYDVVGSAAPETAAPEVTYTVLGKQAPPQNVKNLTVRKRTTDLLLSWEPITDVDAAGYELRVSAAGQSFEQSALIIDKFMGTSFPHVITNPGTYTFYVRALDIVGKRSVNAAVFTLDLVAPESVYGFDVVQADNRLEFRWEANREPDIAAYEIREGESWASASFVARTQSTSYVMPAGTSGLRTFWIKAIANPGIYSINAVFANNSVATPKYANLILTRDESVLQYPGRKLNLIQSGSTITMASSVRRAEYIWTVSLPAQIRAQNNVFAKYLAVPQDIETWQTATYAWSSEQARRTWLNGVATDVVDTRIQIALPRGLDARFLEGWTFDNKVTSVGNRAPSAQKNIAYSPDGRFAAGLNVGQLTVAEYSFTLPAQFTQVFWINPQEVNNNVYLILKGAAGIELRVLYSKSRGGFILEDNTLRQVFVPFDLKLGVHTCVGICQTSSERRLFVAEYDSDNVAYGVGEFAPQGTFTTVKFA